MEFRQLSCFVTVAEELHFGRAAERLCMTQPPLSRQIQLLERTLGLSLFERNSRHVQLTAAGRGFLQDARQLLAHAERAAQLARRTSRGEVGSLSLGFTAVGAYRLMPLLLVRAREVLPGVDIQLREMVSAALGDLLMSGELDVILSRQIPRTPGVEHHLIEREPLVLALPSGSPLASYESVPLSALDRQPFLLYGPNESQYFYERILGAFSLADVTPRIVQLAGQTHTLLALVRAGLGVGIVPDSARELRLDGVVFRPLAQENMHADIFLAWRRHHDNPALTAFLSRVADIEMADLPEACGIAPI